jgi:hypothetical protein
MRSGTITTSNTYSDISLVCFCAIGTSYLNAHLTSASMRLFNAYASQCSSAASVSAYQVTSSWSPSQSLTYPGPSYGTLDAQVVRGRLIGTDAHSTRVCVTTPKSEARNLGQTVQMSGVGKAAFGVTVA